MPNFRLALAPFLALSLGAATTARAQAAPSAPPDSLPFRKGQWGVQFTGSSYLTSLGALRFTSPRAAWLVQLDANVSHQTDRIGGASPTPEGEKQRTTVGGIAARLGRRIYRPLDRRVAGFATAGVTGRYTRIERNASFGYSYSSAAGGGLFGDLGATYLVSEHFGIGASTGVEGTYDRTETRDAITNSRGANLSLRLTQPLALLSVYF